MATLKEQNTTIKPNQIIDVIIRYKWLIIIPFCISITAGIVYTAIAKKTYEASTTILIQPQRVPLQYVQSIVSTDLDQRLNTIAEQILSRSNLEKIIQQFGLFEDAPNMYLEDKISNVRERVNVKIDSSTRRRDSNTDIFYISFKGDQPEKVMRITNTLASYFMDENLKVREAQAVGTSEFLESELIKIKSVLEGKEQLLSEYRSKHMGGLPDELESNLRTLDRLQMQLSDKQSALNQLENTESIINSQIARNQKLLEEYGSGIYQDRGTGKFKVAFSEIEQLYELEKIKLDELLSKYTENHPDIIRLKKSVKTLEEKVETEKMENKGLSQVPGNTSDLKADDDLFENKLQIQRIYSEKRKIESDIGQIQKAMENYQQRVADTPKKEQDLQGLQRDYDNIKENYSSLLTRKLESEIAVNMEKKQKGEQFKILDHARLPEKPINPDVSKVFLLSLSIGLVLGGGIAFLGEFLNSSIKTAEQIESEFSLSILASIPSLKKPGGKMIKRIDMAFFTLFFLYSMSVCSLFALMDYYGLDRTMNFIKTQINL